MSLFFKPPLVTVLRLTGAIGQAMPLRRGLALRGLAGTIEAAFRPRRLVAVALAINSPGGSPVQAALIHNRVRLLAKKRGVPVLAFIEDVAASGGYWLACAGDEIYADENSIVGSIGVISASFGFDKLIERIGIERRVHTAGPKKATLDPFRPEDPEDVKRLESIQGEVHESFKALVRLRRGRRLKAAEDVLFNGDYWTGRRAHELGLVDGLGDLRGRLMDRFGEDVRIQVVGERRGWLARRFGLTRGEGDLPRLSGERLGAGLLAAVEERALWSRFGL
jgi:serine protease SohB